MLCARQRERELKTRKERAKERRWRDVFIWPGGAMSFLLIGLLLRPWANCVTREKYCKKKKRKNPKRQFCLSWDIWKRSCEHTESSSRGREWRRCEAQRQRCWACFPKLMQYPQIEWKRARGHTRHGKLISLSVPLSGVQIANSHRTKILCLKNAHTHSP